jgi:hypothetical protein
MSRMSLGVDTWTPRSKRPLAVPSDPKVTRWMTITGFALRTIFIVALAIVTLHISLPQNETLWTVYDTPGDLIRLLLGIGACGWIAFQLFAAPEDFHSNRTWFYLGLAAVPFALICIVYVW